MNTKQIIALAALALAGTAATADDITMANDRFVSAKSRAEVKAEVLKARAAGVTQFVTEMQPFVDATKGNGASVRTRAEVRAELLKSARPSAGELASAV